MKTDELIGLLATQAEPVTAGATRRRHVLAVVLGSLGAALLLALFLGVRADLAAAARWPMFWAKLALALALAAAAALAATRLARPGVPLGRVPWALAAPVAAIWALAALALATAAPDERAALLLGKTWSVCPLLIAGLSLPPFAALFWAMRGLAPTRPAPAGAAAGLLAGALATFVYAFHCPEMAAPFVATWYLLGMAMPTAAGALLGPRLLRW